MSSSRNPHLFKSFSKGLRAFGKSATENATTLVDFAKKSVSSAKPLDDEIIAEIPGSAAEKVRLEIEQTEAKEQIMIGYFRKEIQLLNEKHQQDLLNSQNKLEATYAARIQSSYDRNHTLNSVIHDQEEKIKQQSESIRNINRENIKLKQDAQQTIISREREMQQTINSLKNQLEESKFTTTILSDQRIKLHAFLIKQKRSVIRYGLLGLLCLVPLTIGVCAFFEITAVLSLITLTSLSPIAGLIIASCALVGVLSASHICWSNFKKNKEINMQLVDHKNGSLPDSQQAIYTIPPSSSFKPTQVAKSKVTKSNLSSNFFGLFSTTTAKEKTNPANSETKSFSYSSK